MAGSPFLRTRVGRRILLLFLFCAVFPLVVLATLGYQHVADDLESINRARLREQTKTSGMMLLDRLASLSTMLKATGNQLGSDPVIPASILDTAATVGPRFRAMAIVGPSGDVLHGVGEFPSLPPLSDEQRAHLAHGEALLTWGSSARGTEVFLVRALDQLPDHQLWGNVLRRSLFGTDPSSSVAPAGMQVCLTTETGESLSCPEGEAPQQTPRNNPAFRWRNGSGEFLAASWTLFLKRAYGAPAWTLTLSVSDRVVSAPLASLQRIFVAGLALALLIVFVLAHIQIRRSTQPLEALEAGTRKLAEGRFDQPVTVKSRDEFESLADSFNRMAGDLGYQFRYQNGLARIHEAALGATGAEAVINTLIANQSSILPGTSIGIALAGTEEPDRWTVVWGRNEGIERAPREVRPLSAELRWLQENPEGGSLFSGSSAPTWFGFGVERELNERAMILPLRWQGNLTGALVVTGNSQRLKPADEAIRNRQTAAEIALALSNTQLVTQLDDLSWGALTALARAIDAVSPWTAGHSERVTLGAMEIGRRMNLTEDDILLLHRGGLLHDVGKVGIPSGILDKPGKLSQEEYDLIKQHPVIGTRILTPIGAFRSALPLVLHHHELLDGSGYPHGLSGEQIPMLVRIMTVADVFDALVSERPYRAAWTTERSLAYLRENVGTKFDSAPVQALSLALEAGWHPTVTPGEVLPNGPSRLSLWPSIA